MILNPDAQVRVEMADGSIPVLYIDDFYSDPLEVREQALAASFDGSGALYPGRHAPIRSPEARAVVNQICAVLSALGDRVFEPATANTDFSILTTKAKDLLGAQKHPHIDPTPVLGLVYLNPGSSSGTCLFRNKVLGFDSVVTVEHREALQQFLAVEGPTFEPSGYNLSGNAAWEKIYTIDGKFNRLVVYPGNVFHSIDVTDVPPSFSIETARLTQRIIIEHTRAKHGPAEPGATV